MKEQNNSLKSKNEVGSTSRKTLPDGTSDTIQSVREELEDREKFQEARLNAHFNKCKKCKPDDYCNLYMIYHHHWIVNHEALKKLNLGVELAQKELLDILNEQKESCIENDCNAAVCIDDAIFKLKKKVGSDK